ncbi:MAG: CBS domain-containing protein [Bacillota bacterium]
MNLIVTHEHGDFDALASAVAAAKIYPDSMIILPEPLHANVRAFVNLNRDLLPLAELRELSAVPRTAVVVDTRKKTRLGAALLFVEQAAEIHIFDHHPPDQDDLAGSEVRVEPVGAVTTLLVEEIRRRGLPLTELEATLMLLGIYEDTGSLTHSASTARDAAAVAFLWELGVKPELLQEYLRTPLTEAQKGLLEKLIEGCEYFELRRRRILLSSTILEEYVRGAAVLFHYLQETEQAELAIILVNMNQSVYLAARTQAEEINLMELLAPLEVRGHPGAVSASIKTADLNSVRSQLLDLLEHFLPPALTAGEVASSPVVTIKSDLSAQSAQNLLDEKGISGCPVMEEGKVAGIISRRDLHKVLRSSLGHAPVRGFMRHPVISANLDDSLTAVRRLMVEHNIGRIPILNFAGEPVGMVTRSDILRTMYRLDRKGKTIAARGRLFKTGEPVAPVTVDDLSGTIGKVLPPRLQGLLLMIGQRAEQAGVRVYLVGGVIRDLLLGQKLPQDLDFVVLPDAIAFAQNLERFLGGKLKVFEQFGTASLFLERGLRLDLVTARKEFYAAPAALPEVETSSLKNDLFRRDFTINTLACSLMPGSFGRLYDFFEGRADLRRGIIRTLYNLSFVDDPLRILRAVRFEQRFGFTIDQGTLELISKAARGNVLDKLSRQRLNHEISLIYKEPDPVAVLRRMDELNVLPFLFPHLAPTAQTWQRLYRVSEAVAWSDGREWETEPDAELVYICGLLYDLDSYQRSAIMRRLHLSREQAETVHLASQATPRILEELAGEAVRRSTVVNRLAPLPVVMLLFMYAMAQQQRVKDYLRLYLDSLQFVQPRVKGGDLKQLGLEPGPIYQKILKELKDAVLDGQVRNYEEELDFVRSFLEQQRNKEG